MNPGNNLVQGFLDIFIQLDKLQIGYVSGSPHACNRQKDKYLFFYRKIHLQYICNPIYQHICNLKLVLVDQLVVRCIQLANKMACQESIQHQGDKLLEISPGTFLQCIGIEDFRNGLHNLLIHRIIAVELLIIVLQDILPDGNLLTMEQQAPANLAYDFQMIWLQIFP